MFNNLTPVTVCWCFAKVFTLILLLGSCSHRSQVQQKTMTIKVTRANESDSWIVEYPRLEGSFAFERNTNRFRSNVFEPVSEGAKIVAEKDYDRLQVDGQKIRPSFRFDSYYEYTPKDYEFFQSMSDGSVLMYTGHLPLCEIKGTDCLPQRTCYEFQGRKSDNIVILGKVFKKKAKWCDNESRGTYVYFGEQKPVSTKDFTLLIDPLMPNWIKTSAPEQLKETFEVYAKETGVTLNFKPYILASYSPGGKHLNSGGGSLPGMLQLSFHGEPWSHNNEISFSKMARFMSHEAAHFWNARMFEYDSRMAWMHEGGADAFAFRRLVKSNVWTRDQMNEALLDSLNLCIERAKGRSLFQITENSDKKEQYYCGSTAMWMAELALKKKNPELGLFDLWREIFRRSNDKKIYSEELFFQVLNEMAGETKTSTFLKKFLYSKGEVSAEAVKSELRAFQAKLQ